MNFVIAPDSFKESMSAMAAAKAIERGIKKVMPDAGCILVPMADGGEGTSECLMYRKGGTKVLCRIHNPLGEAITSDYVWFEKERTAVIEVAKACGIMLIPTLKKDPKIATSYGVGELILNALQKGCRDILITLGGTATNDGGSGMLQALGGKLLDKEGNAIKPGGLGLKDVDSLDLTEPIRRLTEVTFTILCDVKNILLGESGATYVFSPQKGAKPEELPILESAMKHYSEKVTQAIGRDLTKQEGTGAAGGLGYALSVISNVKFVSGCEYMMNALSLEEMIKNCDYVITGEGAIDAQSLQGKVPYGVAGLAKQYHKPVLVFVGRISGSMDEFYHHGVTAVFSILSELNSLDRILAAGEDNLQATVENVMRVILNRK